MAATERSGPEEMPGAQAEAEVRARGNMAPHVRVFLSAPLPTELLTKIRSTQDELSTKAGRVEVRWTRPEQLHLTLKFFGNVPLSEVETLIAAAKRGTVGCGPLQLFIQGLGCFPSLQRPSVIWLGLEGDLAKLQQLQGRLDEQTRAYGSHAEDRAFHPHLTIGRVRTPGQAARRLGQIIREESTLQLGAWAVQTVVLMQSQLNPGGSIYSRLAEFPLAGS